MTAYYNENDPFAAAWLRNLIAGGHIIPGDVDERSIIDVRASDLKNYTQCHFFAGIGGWARALQLAEWPSDRAVWTGSCPCQPLSSAGKRSGHADKRHLWPAFCELIHECRPATIFGEQVASKDGREWLAGIHADLEGLGYAFGAADLCAAGTGAPHIRQRLYWVADACGERRQQEYRSASGDEGPHGRQSNNFLTGRSQSSGMAAADGGIASDGELQRSGEHGQQPQDGGAGGMGDVQCGGREGWTITDAGAQAEIAFERRLSFWSAYDIIQCLDGKARRTGPGIFPLAHGVSNRVGALRGSGNAICAPLAAGFIKAFLEC
jgi:DNA (cytosine-5)-methyltransferase 1